MLIFFSLPISAEHSLVFIFCGDDKSIVLVPSLIKLPRALLDTFEQFFFLFCWQMRSTTINFGKVMRRDCLFAFTMRDCWSRQRTRTTAVSKSSLQRGNPLNRQRSTFCFFFSSDLIYNYWGEKNFCKMIKHGYGYKCSTVESSWVSSSFLFFMHLLCLHFKNKMSTVNHGFHPLNKAPKVFPSCHNSWKTTFELISCEAPTESKRKSKTTAIQFGRKCSYRGIDANL